MVEKRFLQRKSVHPKFVIQNVLVKIFHQKINQKRVRQNNSLQKNCCQEVFINNCQKSVHQMNFLQKISSKQVLYCSSFFQEILNHSFFYFFNFEL